MVGKVAKQVPQTTLALMLLPLLCSRVISRGSVHRRIGVDPGDGQICERLTMNPKPVLHT